MQLVCPETGNSLKKEPAQFKINDLSINQLYIDQKGDGFYAEINGVVYLIKKFFSLEELHTLTRAEFSTVIDKSSLDWYLDYQNGFAKFKYEEFTYQFKRKSDQNSISVLDFISADGNLIRQLKENCTEPSLHTFVALDLDFSALERLKILDADIQCVCSDATKKCFDDNQFDLVFGNSMHHIPEHFDIAIKNISKILNAKGIFYGIESQGFLAKIVIKLLANLPKWVIPYKLSEIYKERLLLDRWLSISLRQRCKDFSGFTKIKRTLFHELYCIVKS